MEAHRLWCRFDGWSDQFRFPLWKEAFEKAGVEMDLGTRKRGFEDPLPWSFIETGVTPAYLWDEYQRGLGEEMSPPCPDAGCRTCGMCDGKTIRVVSHQAQGARFQGRVERERPRNRGMKQKMQLRFTKMDKMRFVSHLELARLFYRASRRAGLFLCHSEGFHPLPRIVFARALPVGVESLGEIVHIELEKRILPQEAKRRLNSVLPQGIEILEAEAIPLFSSPVVLSPLTVYWVSLDHLLEKGEVVTRIKEALGEKELYIHQERKGKKRMLDIRPLIERMELKEGGKGPQDVSPWGVELVVRNEAGRTAKASEILEAVLGLKGESLSRCRIVKVE